MNDDLNDFLAIFNISEKDFESTNLKWEDLQSIKKDYKKIRKELSLIARYIEEKLHTLDIIHSVRYRIKDSNHLLAKIIRKKIEDPQREITIHSYKSSITDLIGIRAIHLFKEDWVFIHKFIKDNWDLHEQPLAYIREGDAGEEYEKYKCNIELHPHGYRSVHYLIQSSPGRDPYFAEIQVRTIFEEGWSEIDHSIKYPNKIINPLLDKFLDTFNTLAGNSDQMGSFVRRLKDDLLKGTEKIEEYEKLTEKNTEIINDLRKRIAGTMGELNSKIRNVESKINSLAASGIAVEPFKNILSEVRLTVSKFGLMMATNPQEAASLLESAEQKLGRLEKLLEMTPDKNNSINNADDSGEEEMAGSYKRHVSYFIHNLKTIAELVGGIAQKTLMKVRGQDDSETKIENAVNEISNRSGFAKFLIGPKYKSIESLSAEIVTNQAKIKALTDAANQIIDPAVRLVLQQQIVLFTQQNNKLQAFVARKERSVSLFGWLVKLFK